jgi:sulfate adenylyltransferase subunit 1/sulfate transport system substrate-binding protein
MELLMASGFPHSVRSVLHAGALVAPFLLAAGFSAQAATTLLNVSYDPTRELYKAINKAFADDWKKKTGEEVEVQASHAGSGAQARAVIDGLAADVVTLALAADIDAIASKTGKIPSDWQKKLPNNASPYVSTIVFLVKKGNPKGIKNWDDLAKPGVFVITPNPKTSGGARWNYLAAWGYGLKKYDGDEGKAKEFVKSIYKNAPVLDTGARGATITFARRGIGDVLIAWENEAFLASEEFGKDKFEIIAPPQSILAEPPVAIVEGNVDAKGTRQLAKAYVDFLYTPTAQAIIAKNYYRPAHPEFADKDDLKRFPKTELITVDKAFGGWASTQKKHFADGGVFDEIQKEIQKQEPSK